MVNENFLYVCMRKVILALNNKTFIQVTGPCSLQSEPSAQREGAMACGPLFQVGHVAPGSCCPLQVALALPLDKETRERLSSPWIKDWNRTRSHRPTFSWADLFRRSNNKCEYRMGIRWHARVYVNFDKNENVTYDWAGDGLFFQRWTLRYFDVKCVKNLDFEMVQKK